VTQLRGALIGALGKCSENVQNIDQVGKTADTMTDVTKVPEEVKDTDKVGLSVVASQFVVLTNSAR